jgi:hypothetical protein
MLKAAHPGASGIVLKMQRQWTPLLRGKSLKDGCGCWRDAALRQQLADLQVGVAEMHLWEAEQTPQQAPSPLSTLLLPFV